MKKHSYKDKVLAVFLSGTLAMTQVALPASAFADTAEGDASSTEQPAAASYAVGDQVVDAAEDHDAAQKNIYYRVLDVEKKTVAIGKPTVTTDADGKEVTTYAASCGWIDGSIPADWKTVSFGLNNNLVIPKTIKDAAGTEWTVKRIEDNAFSSVGVGLWTENRSIHSLTIEANLDYIGNSVIAGVTDVTMDSWYPGDVTFAVAKGGSVSKMAVGAFYYVKSKNTILSFP